MAGSSSALLVLLAVAASSVPPPTSATAAGGCALDGPALGSAPEPYSPVGGGACTGRAAPLSPDPLASYQWGPAVNTTPLQLFTLRAVAATVRHGEANVAGAASLVTNTPRATITGDASIMLDFGRETPGWLEFDSPDLHLAMGMGASVRLGVGEYDAPWQTGPAPSQHKAGAPRAYPAAATSTANGANATTPATTYRLETNPQLYEGVRYGFLEVSASSSSAAAAGRGEGGRPLRLPAKPFAFTITGLRLVVQTKAVNYTGHFHSPTDAMLEKVWWTAAWTVRSNLLEEYFGSILMDRGDREAWTGDAHPSQAAALVAFHNLDFIKQNLASSIHGAGAGFPTYQCYWVLSILDYYTYTGDEGVLQMYASKVASLVLPLLRTASKGAVTLFEWVFSLISLGRQALPVRPCGPSTRAGSHTKSS